MNRGFFSNLDPIDLLSILASMGSNGRSSRGLQGLIEALGIEDEIAELAKKEVDEGATDCDCGEADCPMGIAIRAEVENRRKVAEDKNPVMVDYRMLQPHITADIEKSVTAGVEAGTVKAIREILSDKKDDPAQLQAANIIANAVYSAGMRIITDNWVYKYIYLPIKVIFQAVMTLVALLLVKVVFPLIGFALFLVLFVPGFLFGFTFNRRVRSHATQLYIKGRMMKDLKGAKSDDDFMAAILRYASAKDHTSWRTVRRTLPRSLRAGTDFAGRLGNWRTWGPRITDRFWEWWYTSEFLDKHWTNREEHVARLGNWLINNRLSTWARQQKSRWEQSHHPVDTSVVGESADYTREQSGAGDKNPYEDELPDWLRDMSQTERESLDDPRGNNDLD